jgi:hypothetical protein
VTLEVLLIGELLHRTLLSKYQLNARIIMAIFKDRVEDLDGPAVHAQEENAVVQAVVQAVEVVAD